MTAAHEADREEIQRKTAEFLRSGGKVTEVPSGVGSLTESGTTRSFKNKNLEASQRGIKAQQKTLGRGKK